MSHSVSLFLSSTFVDLVSDREAAIGEMDRIGHTVAMERFGARPYPALDVCLDALRQTRLLILLIGQRYGTVAPERGVSYTEAEFDEAMARGIPVLAFFKAERRTGGHGLQPVAPDSQTDGEALGRFRQRVQDAVVRELYERPDQLPLLIRRAVDELVAREGRLDLRGRTLVATEPYFAPYLAANRAFHHGRPLSGRTDELDAIRTAMSEGTRRVATIAGRGGIGKTRLLLEVARWASEHGWRVRWVRTDVGVEPDILAEMPAGDILIVSDDAHRQRGLETLLRAVCSRTDRTFVLLGARPWGRPLLERAMADAMIDPAEHVDLGTMGQLPRKAFTRLVREELGPDLASHAAVVVKATGDSTLVALVGARLVRTANVPLALLEKVDEFRHTVLARFAEITLGDFQGLVDPRQARVLLELISATGPLRANPSIGVAAQKWRATAAKWIGVREPDILRLLGVLEQGEVIGKLNGELRVVPDVLADHLLSAMTVSAAGEPTGMGTELLDAFGDAVLPNLIVNLSELDWRLERSGTSARVLEEVWDRFTQHFRAGTNAQRVKLLKVLRPVAATQPARALDVLGWLEANPKGDSGSERFSTDARVLDAGIAVAKIAAQSREHVNPALDYLWRRGRDERVTGIQKDQGASPSVEEMIEYHLDRPVWVNEAAEMAFERWTSEGFDTRWPERPQLPFFVAHKLFDKEIVSSKTRGLEVRMRPHRISPSATADIRKRLIARCTQLLGHSHPRVRLQATEALLEGLRAPDTSFARQLTLDEEQGWWPFDQMILDAFETYAHRQAGPVSQDADPLVLVRIKDNLPWLGRRALVPDKRSRCYSLWDAIDETPAMLRVRAYGNIWPDEIDEEHSSVRRDRAARALKATDGVSSAATSLLSASEVAAREAGGVERVEEIVDHLLDQLERVDAQFRDARVPTQAADLYQALVRIGDNNDSGFGSALAERLLRHKALAWWFAAALNEVRETKAAEYATLGEQALTDENPTCRRALAVVLNGVIWGRRGLSGREEGWLQQLLNDPDVDVRERALHALGGRGVNRTTAVRLLLGARITDEPKLTSEFADVADHLLGHGEAEELSEGESLALLARLAHVPRFDHSTVRIDGFLTSMAKRVPMSVLQFCLARLERQYASDRRSEDGDDDIFFGPHHFDALPPFEWAEVWDALQTTLGEKHLRAAALELVGGAALATDGMHLQELARLFGRIAMPDETTVAFLRASLAEHSAAKESLRALIAHLPLEFVLERSGFVLASLEGALGHGDDAARAMAASWLQSTLRGDDRIVVRDVGVSDPRDVRLLGEASAIAATLAAGSAGKQLYAEIANAAAERVSHDSARREERQRMVEATHSSPEDAEADDEEEFDLGSG